MKQETNWREYLKPEEADELLRIAEAKKAGQVQARRIWDRCRKRMRKS